MSSVKSFKKNREQQPSTIAGTKFSPNNFSLLTSSGLSSLDTLLGGGLPVGSLLLIEEDQCGHYAETIAKHFVSEGILSNHRIVIASQDTDVDQFLTSLPGPLEEKNPEIRKEDASNADEITIAWRYKNLKLADSSISETSNFGHKLQINMPLQNKHVESADVFRWSRSSVLDSEAEACLFSKLFEFLNDPRHIVENDNNRQVARIALLNLGSPCWDIKKITPMLYSLRSWLRKSVAVGIITVPSHLYKESCDIWKWINFADICIKLESFAGTPRAQNPALKDYHGFFHIVKLPAFNSIAPHIPPSDLSFKLRRRKFMIERLSLPPELEDTSARGNTEKFTGCGSAVKSSLDF